MQTRFLQLLFDPQESTCFGVTERDWRVQPAHTPPVDAQFFCLNPLRTDCDLAPTAEWHREGLPRRADHNVISMRNFLVEFDRPGLTGAEVQMEFVGATGMPWTTAVWSGGKSCHFVIALQESIATIPEFKALARSVVGYLGADSSCTNPSRFSRLGGAVRENGQGQRILELRERIPNDEFFRWMMTLPKQQMPAREFRVVKPGRSPSHVTLLFAEYGPCLGEQRTRALFAAACDLAECGYTLEGATKMLETTCARLYKQGEYPEDKAEKTIADAFKRVNT